MKVYCECFNLRIGKDREECGWKGTIEITEIDDLRTADCPDCGLPSLIRASTPSAAPNAIDEAICTALAAKAIMPFGKHKGKQLDQIPLEYLDWIMGLEDIREPFKTALETYMNDPAIQEELGRQMEEGP